MPAKQRKIAVMGSRSVGKSSLAIQFVQARFSFFIYVDNFSLFALFYGSYLPYGPFLPCA
jgi:AAA+ ATPase superfamily predicted ATPase